MRLVMTLKVRDEADIIEHNLRYHRGLGVDFFVVTDNASTDGTSEVLKRYADAGLAHVIRDETTELRANEVDWTTRMARIAATEHDADWVFHNDADEFWWPLEGTIKDALESIPEEYGAVVSPRTEYVARPDGPGSFADRLVVREARSSLQPKVAHRGDPDVVVLSNTHEVASAGSGDLWRALRPPGRVVHRGVRGTGPEEGEEDVRLIWAPTWPLRIFHFPLRSYDQFVRRTEIFLRYGGFRDSGRFKRLRRYYEEGRLDEIYDGLVWDDDAVEDGIRDGQLVRDERIAKFLPRCPDPLEGAPAGAVAVEPDPEELARERIEVQLDAMRLLTRTTRFTMLQLDKSRDRLDELRETNDALRSKLGRTLGRRLLKMARRRRRRAKELEAGGDGGQPAGAAGE
jgi:Glycosyl transferase family 2